MKKAIIVFLLLVLLADPGQAQKKSIKSTQTAVVTGSDDRKFWLTEMDKMIRPVIRSLAHDSLRINMPLRVSVRSDNPEQRRQVAYLEVLGRVLSGIGPWLEGEGGNAAEVSLRATYREWVLQGLHNAMDSTSKDFMRFDIAGQQLVDASFLAFGLIRAPWIMEHLDAVTKERLVNSIRITRHVRPPFNNWLLFAAMNEVFFARFGYEWDVVRVDYALRQLEQWYAGDGMYMDGTSFAFDYYNSFVIHPYLATVSAILKTKTKSYDALIEKIMKRNERYAVIQERLINADGSYPAIGRSIIYRGAAFHHLADMAWRKHLPAQLTPAAVRCALTAVIRKTLESPSTYDAQGWLTLGLYGEQPSIADSYNNAGSPYLCTAVFLPLGLPDTDPFWSAPAAKFSAQRIWSGEDFPNDHSEGLK